MDFVNVSFRPVRIVGARRHEHDFSQEMPIIRTLMDAAKPGDEVVCRHTSASIAEWQAAIERCDEIEAKL